MTIDPKITGIAATATATAPVTNRKTIARKLRGVEVEATEVNIDAFLAEVSRINDNRKADREAAKAARAASKTSRIEAARADLDKRFAIFSSLSSDDQDSVAIYQFNGSRQDVMHEMAGGIVNAVAREVEARGWTVRHISKGLGVSAYIDIPGVGSVRVSDHDLPMTSEREHNWSHNRGKGWDGEVVTRNHINERLEKIMRRVILAAAGRVE